MLFKLFLIGSTSEAEIKFTLFYQLLYIMNSKKGSEVNFNKLKVSIIA